MTHLALMTEVTHQLSLHGSKFKPNVSDIKRAIDILIDKEYIKRDEEQSDLIHYMA